MNTAVFLLVEGGGQHLRDTLSSWGYPSVVTVEGVLSKIPIVETWGKSGYQDPTWDLIFLKKVGKLLMGLTEPDTASPTVFCTVDGELLSPTMETLAFNYGLGTPYTLAEKIVAVTYIADGDEVLLVEFGADIPWNTSNFLWDGDAGAPEVEKFRLAITTARSMVLVS